MAKRPTLRNDPTPEDPMRAWLSNDKNGKLRAYRYNKAGHYYMHKPSGVQRKTHWLTVAADVVRELSLCGLCVLCDRSNVAIVDTKAGAQGFYAFFDGKQENESPYRGETFPTNTNVLNDGELWVFGWRTAHDY